MGPRGAWLDRLLCDPSLGPEHDEELATKKSAFKMALFTALIGGCNALLITARLSSYGSGGVPVLGCAVLLTACTLAAAARMAATRGLSPTLVEQWVVPIAVLVLCMEYLTLGVTGMWTLEVLAMDAMLSFGAPPSTWEWNLRVTSIRASQVVLVLTCAYLLVSTLQDVADFGFWAPVEGDSPYKEFKCPRISTSLAGATVIMKTAVFVLDFFVTRGFVAANRAQCTAMKESQRVTEVLTELLSAYQVGKAQEVVDESSQALPPELRSSFLALIANLTTYKPFLPQSCLPDEGPAGSAEHLASSVSDSRARGHSPGSAAYPAHGSRIMDASSSPGRVRASGSRENSSHLSDSELSGSLLSDGGIQKGAIQAVPARVRVTCISTNMCGFLSWLHLQGVQAAEELLRSEIELFADAATQFRGVVDALSGDHFRASFNSARFCASHRQQAVRSAFAFNRRLGGGGDTAANLKRTSAVCSGAAVCGDFGGATIVRYMIVGGVFNLLGVLERAAATWGIGVLVDPNVGADINDTWRLRLLGCATFPKQGERREFNLWETDGERASGAAGAEEWMYELADMADPWQTYNVAVRRWLVGDVDGAQAAAAAAADADRADDAVRAALGQLIADLASAEAPPRFELTEGGVVGAGPRPRTPADVLSPIGFLDATASKSPERRRG
eukprot:TRINITY_DN1056_c0_g2_i2.p1 TRINITY_DN1056_c0_g2~~TRINITY_DN1056_c0_g2_i2.p1  ORF type:complete len:702 (+),score=153.09 TRINITY_DN1056_c0_g2_i2:85-2106(+)